MLNLLQVSQALCSEDISDELNLDSLTDTFSQIYKKAGDIVDDLVVPDLVKPDSVEPKIQTPGQLESFESNFPF